MYFIAAGDSFVWGSELKDSFNEGQNGYSQNTFPALLSQNYQYICAARPGNANNAISRMAMNACCRYHDVFLLTMWTYPQRVEFRFNDQWVSINSWHTEKKQFSEAYFKNVGDNEYYEIYSTLKEIVLLQDFCKLKNIPYLFTTADNYFYKHENYTRCKDNSLTNLYNLVDWDKWFWFPDDFQENETLAPRGFYQWANENKYSMGPQGHPLEEAHQDAAILIKGKFNELVEKSR